MQFFSNLLSLHLSSVQIFSSAPCSQTQSMFFPQCQRPSFTHIPNHRQNYGFVFHVDPSRNVLFKTWNSGLICHNLCSDKSTSIGHNFNVNNAALSNLIYVGIAWGLSQMGPCSIFFNVSVLICVGEMLLPPLEPFHCHGHKTLGRREEEWLLQNVMNSFRDWRSVITALKEDIGKELSNSRSSPHSSYAKRGKPWFDFRTRSGCINILFGSCTVSGK
jgi:hypothetical protein